MMLKPEVLGQLKLPSFGVEVPPRYNITPKSRIPAIVHDGKGGLHLVVRAP